MLRNNVTLFDQEVAGFHVPTSFSTALTLAQNDTIDFAVGFGANGTYFDDNTGAHVVITVVPEPPLLALTAAGIGLFIVSMARRTRRPRLRWSRQMTPVAHAGSTRQMSPQHGQQDRPWFWDSNVYRALPRLELFQQVHIIYHDTVSEVMEASRKAKLLFDACPMARW